MRNAGACIVSDFYMQEIRGGKRTPYGRAAFLHVLRRLLADPLMPG